MKKLIFSVLLLITMSSYAQTSILGGAGYNTDSYSVLQAGIMHNFRHFNLQAGVYTPIASSPTKETLWHVQVGKEICLNRDLTFLPAVGFGYGSENHSTFIASTYLYWDIDGRFDVFGGATYPFRSEYAIFSGGLAFKFNNGHSPERKYRNW